MQSYDVKRFVDWWRGDDAFRARFDADPAGAAADYGLRVDPDVARALSEAGDDECPHPELEPYYRDLHARQAVVDDLHRAEAAITNVGFAGWRQRQRRRFASQAPDSWGRQNPHLVFAVELSAGCSMACAFCAGAPGRLERVSRLTPENEALFRGVLRAIAQFAGCPSPSGLLYHFTEPLDNPDYEKYLQAYHQELGTLPRTTTAAWARRPDRTRRLLAMTRDLHGRLPRFSINSVDLFRSCMRLFTPEDLRDVVLLRQYPEAGAVFYRSGRARSIPGAVDGTVACVSGFLLNLPSRTIQLVSPCIEPSAWPMGFRSLVASTFRTESDLPAFFAECRARVLDRVLHDATPVALRDDLSMTEDEGRLLLRTHYRQHSFADGLQQAVLRRCRDARPLAGLIDELSDRYAAGAVFAFVQLLWDSGLLADADVVAAPELTLS